MTSASTSGPNVRNLILAPAIISFAITILRLVGELNQWSPGVFSREAGGGGSWLGISWLVPIFGAYFAVKLVRDGYTPKSNIKVILFAILGAAVSMGIMMAFFSHGVTDVLFVLASFVGAGAGIALQRIAWPELFRTLLTYAFAARIPVALVMLVVISGSWGTHYDVAPPGGIPEMSALATWFYIGFVPQFTGWIMFTTVIGSLAGGIAAIAMRAKAPEEAAQTS